MPDRPDEMNTEQKITSFPGLRCLHYVQGRCLLEESRNPGWNSAWRCKVLVAWEEEYERFLTQAENFNLELELAAKIWRQRLGSLLSEPAPCPNYQPGRPDVPAGEEDEDEEDVACAFSWIGLCLFALPVCSGVCCHFVDKVSVFGDRGR